MYHWIDHKQEEGCPDAPKKNLLLDLILEYCVQFYRPHLPKDIDTIPETWNKNGEESEEQIISGETSGT